MKCVDCNTEIEPKDQIPVPGILDSQGYPLIYPYCPSCAQRWKDRKGDWKVRKDTDREKDKS